MADSIYNEGACVERHKTITERLDNHEERLNKHDELFDRHDDKLEILATDTAVHTNQIDKLCEEIKSLVSTIKWFIGLIGASFIGFFFYAIQQHLFK